MSRRHGRRAMAFVPLVASALLLTACGSAPTPAAAPVSPPTFVVPTSPAVLPATTAPEVGLEEAVDVEPLRVPSPDLRPGQRIDAGVVKKLCPPRSDTVRIVDPVTPSGRAPALPKPLTAMVVCDYDPVGGAPNSAVVTTDAAVRRWAQRIESMTEGRCPGGLNALVGGPSAEVTFIGRSGATTRVSLNWSLLGGDLDGGPSGPVSERSVESRVSSEGVGILCGPQSIVVGLASLADPSTTQEYALDR